MRKVYSGARTGVKTTYKYGKGTVRTVARDIKAPRGKVIIRKKSKKKKRWVTPAEFNRAAFGY